MSVHNRFIAILVALISATFFSTIEVSAAPSTRGFQIALESITPEKLDELSATWGVKVLRAQVGDNFNMDGTTGAAYDAMLEPRFKLVEEKLALLQARGMKMIFCLSSPPGGFLTREAPSHYLMYSQPELQNQFIQKWREIVARFGSHPSILAFDIENEPAMRESLVAAGARKWNQLLLDTIAAIRETHPTLPLIVKSLYGDPTKLSKLPAINDPYVSFSYNAYPYNKYQHTGIGNAPFSIAKPTDAAILNNIRTRISSFFFKVYSQAQKGEIAKSLYPPKLIVGEAAVSACADSGASFLNGLLDSLERDESIEGVKARDRALRRWKRARARNRKLAKPKFVSKDFRLDVAHSGWFIHAFAEAPIWDPRYVCDTAGSLTLSTTDTDRAIVAKSFFSRN
jgi:hypothetical protein